MIPISLAPTSAAQKYVIRAEVNGWLTGYIPGATLQCTQTSIEAYWTTTVICLLCVTAPETPVIVT
jgi:hypothetical protein